MAQRIEDYALLGDTHSACLVGRDGSIDWLCVPRFDSDGCFAALLGGPEHGRWLLAPVATPREVRRAYRDYSLVLETEQTLAGGVARITDCMPPRDEVPNLVRVVECVSGRVRLRTELAARFGYGRTLPWIRPNEGGFAIVSGPDALQLQCTIPLEVVDGTLRGEFELRSGDRATFVLSWHPSHLPAPPPLDALATIAKALRYWAEWAGRCTYRGPWREAVVRSLVTLKALTYRPTGGLVAAPTTSLPERIGGVRNWDYRFCWVRDATITLDAMLVAGYGEEAAAWRDWLLRASAGEPSQLQIMYGLGGERRLTEWEVPWLPGFEGSRPVRVGNAASTQHQLDIYGELMDCLHGARSAGLAPSGDAWALQRAVVEHVERCWTEPDEGIWELRSGRRHLVHSKVMAWTALDRAVKAVERHGLQGPVERWRRVRRAIHTEICERGFDPSRKTFVQAFGSRVLDASLLMIPLVGFLPVQDPRVVGTIEAVQRELLRDGFLQRYPTDETDDGLPAGEGAFLPCSFWLADCLALLGRREEAVELFERLLAIRTDLGLLSEEYDPTQRRLVGNFPQAFSHVALVNTARNLAASGGPAEGRSTR